VKQAVLEAAISKISFECQHRFRRVLRIFSGVNSGFHQRAPFAKASVDGRAGRERETVPRRFVPAAWMTRRSGWVSVVGKNLALDCQFGGLAAGAIFADGFVD
jgi:hypothetical protein